MRKRSGVTFSELRSFLNGLGFKHKHTEGAWVFHHPDEGLIVFRDYGESEAVDEGDLRSTRTFLDLRGQLDGQAFDALVQGAGTRARARTRAAYKVGEGEATRGLTGEQRCPPRSLWTRPRNGSRSWSRAWPPATRS